MFLEIFKYSPNASWKCKLLREADLNYEFKLPTPNLIQQLIKWIARAGNERNVSPREKYEQI